MISERIFSRMQMSKSILPQVSGREEAGQTCVLEEIEKDIQERDERDMTRETAPLKQAEDAVLIDSSEMTIEEVVQAILSVCK